MASDVEIEHAITVYKSRYLKPKAPECADCMENWNNVLYDSESSDYYCDSCVENSLREDIPTLMELTK